jgi:hypothetical protein
MSSDSTFASMNIIQFLSAFGLGAIVAAVVQAWLSHRSYVSKRNFEEKKETYIGFLDALHQSEVERTEEAALNVGHWQNRIQLVGSRNVIEGCERIRETNPISGSVHPERPKVLRDLKEAMRRDLGVTKR